MVIFMHSLHKLHIVICSQDVVFTLLTECVWNLAWRLYTESNR